MWGRRRFVSTVAIKLTMRPFPFHLLPPASSSGIRHPQNPLDFVWIFDDYHSMPLPNQPVTLNVEQIGELNKKLATLRHDVNNNLALVVAAAEIIRRKPESAERMWNRPGGKTAKNRRGRRAILARTGKGAGHHAALTRRNPRRENLRRAVRATKTPRPW